LESRCFGLGLGLGGHRVLFLFSFLLVFFSCLTSHHYIIRFPLLGWPLHGLHHPSQTKRQMFLLTQPPLFYGFSLLFQLTLSFSFPCSGFMMMGGFSVLRRRLGGGGAPTRFGLAQKPCRIEPGKLSFCSAAKQKPLAYKPNLVLSAHNKARVKVMPRRHQGRHETVKFYLAFGVLLSHTCLNDADKVLFPRLGSQQDG
jgi:hypothetical protein